jgi:glycosyltransferase involved in cell wall biosynthesis
VTDAGPRRRPRLLLVSMYPLDRGRWGPTVRIGHLRDELDRLVDLDVVTGYRGPRRLALARYALSGRLRGLDGVYVESSSFLPAETDVAFLGLARALGIPVLTYVRDAYQLFPDDYPRGSWRQRIGAAAFAPAVRALRAVSTRLAFPTRGLAVAVLGDAAGEAVLLPPGAPEPVWVARADDAHHLLFVGDARLPAHGADRLIDAVGRARGRGAGTELLVVCRPGQEPPPPHPDWLHVARAEGRQIHALLPGVLASVIPRPRSAYNDLALPVKLFEYLSYGRPVLVTDCTEQAAVVREAGAGPVVADGPERIADAIVETAGAGPDQLEQWSTGARDAASAASWRSRAERIVELLAGAS